MGFDGTILAFFVIFRSRVGVAVVVLKGIRIGVRPKVRSSGRNRASFPNLDPNQCPNPNPIPKPPSKVEWDFQHYICVQDISSGERENAGECGVQPTSLTRGVRTLLGGIKNLQGLARQRKRGGGAAMNKSLNC